MSKFYRLLITSLNSWVSVAFIVFYCIASFYLGQLTKDMNLFSASGAVITVFGLFSMIRFTTIEKFFNQEQIIANSTGVTGPPLADGEYEKIVKASQDAARIKLKRELRSEVKGIFFTIFGTLVWAYGAYIPIIRLCTVDT